MSTKTKTAAKTKRASSNGTRKAPVRTIVKRLPGSKKGRYIAVLACGHKLSKGTKWPIKTLRCKRCLTDGPVKKVAVKKVAPKKATVNGTKAVNGKTNGGAK